MTPANPEDRLRHAALRITKQRIAVLGALDGHPHIDVASVTRAVRAELGAVSTQAVYDILAALSAAGLVRKIEPAGSPALYELGDDGDHHHAVCRGCGAVADVPATGRRILRAAPGFVVEDVEVTLWGRCRACQAEDRDRRKP